MSRERTWDRIRRPLVKAAIPGVVVVAVAVPNGFGWSGVAAGVMASLTYVMWGVAARKVGRYNAVAVVGLVAAVLTSAVVLLSPSCPGVLVAEQRRCSFDETLDWAALASLTVVTAAFLFGPLSWLAAKAGAFFLAVSQWTGAKLHSWK